MKKLFILSITLLTFAVSSFANDPINSVVLNSFNKAYAHATAPSWTVTKDFIRVRFSLEGEVLVAYYNQSGDQIAVIRNIKTAQLPLALAAVIQTKYGDYYLAGLFEISSDTETFYYATVRKGDCTIVLKASPYDTWRIYKKERGN